ncbi:MAG: hypothetical protein H0W94_02175 [Actinobacteria bacterium]|nr:hypothetical protein [Actinomycetota bacterium]
MLVFDVNETMLDLGVLREPCAEVFGDAAALGEWFARLLHGSLVATLTDAYEDFASIGRRALDDVAASRRGRALSDEDRDAILGTMRRLPAHTEVPDALDRLRSAASPSPPSRTPRTRRGHSWSTPASSRCSTTCSRSRMSFATSRRRSRT